MNIIAHRGFWIKKSEQNTLAAFKRAIDDGFGIETDIRDYQGSLVIAHDLPSSKALPASQAFAQFSRMKSNQALAINVKSCGLAKLTVAVLKRHPVPNYFIFDAAVPDAVQYMKEKLPVFTRQSEYEQHPSFLPQAQGVWLDSFRLIWYNAELIEKYIRLHKKVVIVSPELHGRSCRGLWRMLKAFNPSLSQSLYLCTDFPQEAKKYFTHGIKSNEKD